jgi:hypothetical protein
VTWLSWMNQNVKRSSKQPEEPRAAMVYRGCPQTRLNGAGTRVWACRRADLPGRLGLGPFSWVRAASLSHERCHTRTDSRGHIGLSNTLTGMNVDR